MLVTKTLSTAERAVPIVQVGKSDSKQADLRARLPHITHSLDTEWQVERLLRQGSFPAVVFSIRRETVREVGVVNKQTDPDSVSSMIDWTGLRGIYFYGKLRISLMKRPYILRYGKNFYHKIVLLNVCSD